MTRQERKLAAPPRGFRYVPAFLDADEQDELLRLVRALDFQRDEFRGQPLKRRYAQFGYTYVSTGRKLEAAPPMPDFLLALAAKGLAHCPEGTQFTMCIVTHYPPGAGIGWHTDAPRFEEYILAVSLGAAGRLQFRPNGAEDASSEVVVAPGSLYVLRGPARWKYQHQVVRVKAERFSITFRGVNEKDSP